MKEYVILIASLLFMITVGIRSSVTDLRSSKVYNRDLLIVLLVGVVFQIISASFTSLESQLWWILVFLCVLIIGYAFYIAHIWAAGDAKLIAVLFFAVPSFLIPSFHEVVPYAILLPGFVFSFGFLFIFAESVFLFVRDLKSKVVLSSPATFLQDLVRQLMHWLLSYNLICLLQLGWGWVNSAVSIPSWLILVPDIAAVSLYFQLADTKMKMIISGIVIFTVRVFLMIWLHDFSTLLSIWPFITAIMILLLRALIGRYNYREIPTESVRPGMVLAQASLPYMLASRVKGLPETTDETTRSRLTSAQAEAILRWKNSKYGQDTLWIVRHIPFAPFITVGSVFYLVFLVIVR